MRSVKSRSWSNQEDQNLSTIVNTYIQNNKKPSWNQVAERIQDMLPQFNKNGKQCRQRWSNHINPQVNRDDQWTKQENDILFTLHKEMGNRWSEISMSIPGRTDNFMRRGLRKMNSFIKNVKRKQVLVKTLKNDLLVKVLAICQGKSDSKFQFSNQAKELAVEIKSNLAIVSLDGSQQDNFNIQLKQKLYQQISQFKKNCRKKKGKRQLNSQQNSQSSVYYELNRKQAKKKNVNQQVSVLVQQQFPLKKSSIEISYEKQSFIQYKKMQKKDESIEHFDYVSEIQNSNKKIQVSQVFKQALMFQRRKSSEKNLSLSIFSQDKEKQKQSQKQKQKFKQSQTQKQYEKQNPSMGIQQKNVQDSSQVLQKSNLINSSMINSSVIGSRLLSSFSNLYPQRSNSSLFNFVPAAYVDMNNSFLNTVQEVTKKKDGQQQDYKGLFDFTGYAVMPNQFAPLFQYQQLQIQQPGFANAFGMSPIVQPLSGSFPFTTSSAGFSLFNDPSKSSKQKAENNSNSMTASTNFNNSLASLNASLHLKQQQSQNITQKRVKQQQQVKIKIKQKQRDKEVRNQLQEICQKQGILEKQYGYMNEQNNKNIQDDNVNKIQKQKEKQKINKESKGLHKSLSM